MLTVGEFVCAISRSKPKVGRVLVFLYYWNGWWELLHFYGIKHCVIILGTGSLLFGSGGGNELHLLTLL